jgi:putative hemolysin
MVEIFIILIILIFFSGFFSGSEIAYVVSNKIKLEIKARKKNLAAKNAFHYVKNPQDFFSTILIGNNVINIAFASLSTIFLLRLFSFDEFTILVITSFILLIFGELIPKYFSRELADRVVLYTSIPLRGINFILYPFVKITSMLSSIIIPTTSAKEEKIDFLFGKEDIESLVKESHEAGVVDKNESSIIRKVFALGDQRVYETMRPRTDIVGIEINENLDKVISQFMKSGYSKLPVYDESLDNIKGVVYAYDLFKFPENLQSIIKEVIFVPETKRSFEMLNEFLTKQVSIAVVVDEFGGTAGIVTMEDIIEELFGEIKDEYDVEEDILRKIAPDTYLISGKVEIDFINENYDLKIPSGDYETIAGFIVYHSGRIPAQGEIIKILNYTFLIARSTNIKIELVKLTVEETDN